MNEFTTHITNKNKIDFLEIKERKERLFYLGLAIFILGAFMFAEDFEFGIHFCVVGLIIMLVEKLMLARKAVIIKNKPLKLTLTPNSITIGENKFEIKNKNDISIKISGYKGEYVQEGEALYQTQYGNKNELTIKHGDKVSELKFALETAYHKDSLIRFCEDHGFKYIS